MIIVIMRTDRWLCAVGESLLFVILLFLLYNKGLSFNLEMVIFRSCLVEHYVGEWSSIIFFSQNEVMGNFEPDDDIVL